MPQTGAAQAVGGREEASYVSLATQHPPPPPRAGAPARSAPNEPVLMLTQPLCLLHRPLKGVSAPHRRYFATRGPPGRGRGRGSTR